MKIFILYKVGYIHNIIYLCDKVSHKINNKQENEVQFRFIKPGGLLC